jgi:hypothetical protein
MLTVFSLSYRKWSDCPPRAPLGRADALYGSHDHLILLLGRVTDFAVRDRARKLRQVDADGDRDQVCQASATWVHLLPCVQAVSPLPLQYRWDRHLTCEDPRLDGQGDLLLVGKAHDRQAPATAKTAHLHPWKAMFKDKVVRVSHHPQ